MKWIRELFPIISPDCSDLKEWFEFGWALNCHNMDMFCYDVGCVIWDNKHWFLGIVMCNLIDVNNLLSFEVLGITIFFARCTIFRYHQWDNPNGKDDSSKTIIGVHIEALNTCILHTYAIETRYERSRRAHNRADRITYSKIWLKIILKSVKLWIYLYNHSVCILRKSTIKIVYYTLCMCTFLYIRTH